MIKTFIISSELFWGWKSSLNTSKYNTHEKIIKKVKDDLKEFLNSRNLLELVKKVDEMTLHIHNEMHDIIHEDNPLGPFYLCDHCHTKLS
jgi:hypothetical protein